MIISRPNLNEPFKVYCDASINGVGAVLTQVHQGRLRPVQFTSTHFSTKHNETGISRSKRSTQ